MSGLSWNWLAAPYFACALMMLAAVIAAGLVRGDRVMRLGVIGMGTTALPWAVCSALAACMPDAHDATRILRLGQGPVALVGPNFMLVLLGVSGQLERHRWLARISGLVGIVLLGLCWATDWIVPGVRLLDSGIYYPVAGPLTDLHFSQLVIWMLIGAYVARGASSKGEKRRLVRLVVGIIALGGIGSIDTLLIHGIWGSFPIAWLPAFVATTVMFYLVVWTDLLRPQGVDRGAVIELAGFTIATVLVGTVAWFFEGAAPVIMAAATSIVWVIALGATWGVVRTAPIREVMGERALAQFVAALTDLEDERMIGERLAALWKPFAIEVRAAWRIEGEQLIDTQTGATWAIDNDVITWLVQHEQAVAPSDLATMRLGAKRAKLEALVTAHDVSLVIPLVDRGSLVGIVEANHDDALREEERQLVAESSRAAARAITYASLARAAAREGATAREVEVAEALRQQASASRDDELGRWTVAAEYRTAPRTTGAGWSATLLNDGRLAVLVTEAQAHGVAAALATAALTGAFAAATVGSKPLELDDLLTSLRASAEGVMRGGEPIAAFIALVDGDRQRVTWATAGHPGAFVVGPVAYDLAKFPLGSTSGPRPKSIPLGGGSSLGASLVTATRGETALPHDSLLVIASTAVRGDDQERFETSLRDQAPAGPRLAQILVETAAKRGDSNEDLLAVIVRQRPDRRSEPVMTSTPEPA